MGRPSGSTNKPKPPHAVLDLPAITRLDLMAPAFGAADGYGNSAEQMAIALERRGVRVQLSGLVRRCGTITAESILQRRFEPEAPAIVFYSQPTSWFRQFGGRRGIGFSMFETDQLPQSWGTGLRNVDEIWVPSTWLVEPFAQASGKPVHVVPLGVDGDRFAYKRRERGAKLRFLHFATASEDVRKGLDLAQRAFVAAFPPERDDVELVARSQYVHGVERRDPRVQYVFGLASPAQILAEMHAADALLYTTRGEGFGLIPLEAIATGMPAIFADATGPADYAPLGLTVSAKRAAAPLLYGGSWFEPDFDELVERLRQVDREYDSLMDDAAANADLVRSEWTWDRSAAAILARLTA